MRLKTSERKRFRKILLVADERLRISYWLEQIHVGSPVRVQNFLVRRIEFAEKVLQWEPVSVGAGVGFERDFLIAEFGLRREGQASGSGEYI